MSVHEQHHDQRVEGMEGWGKPTLSRVWHYFTADGRALCGSWGFMPGPFEIGNDDSPNNCKTCRRRLERRRAAST